MLRADSLERDCTQTNKGEDKKGFHTQHNEGAAQPARTKAALTGFRGKRLGVRTELWASVTERQRLVISGALRQKKGDKLEHQTKQLPGSVCHRLSESLS